MVVHAGSSMSMLTQPPTLPRESLNPEDITQANKLSQKLMEIWDETAIQITPYEDTKTIQQDDELMLYSNGYWFESLIARRNKMEAAVKAEIRRPLPDSFVYSDMWKKFETERTELGELITDIQWYKAHFRAVTTSIGDTIREIANLRREIPNRPLSPNEQSKLDTLIVKCQKYALHRNSANCLRVGLQECIVKLYIIQNMLRTLTGFSLYIQSHEQEERVSVLEQAYKSTRKLTSKVETELDKYNRMEMEEGETASLHRCNSIRAELKKVFKRIADIAWYSVCADYSWLNQAEIEQLVGRDAERS